MLSMAKLKRKKREEELRRIEAERKAREEAERKAAEEEARRVEAEEAERQRIAAARRVLASIHAELDKLNRSRPPLDDPEKMAPRSRRREELRAWAAAPRALVDRLEARRRAALRPDVRGVLRVLLR